MQFRLNTEGMHTPKGLCSHFCVSFRPLYCFFGFINKGKKKLHACLQEPASSGRGHLSKYSPTLLHHHLLFLHRPERERERGRLAGMAEESRAKSLNVPQQQHQELRRGQPVCAPVCQFTGPKWHCWEESMFLS